MGLDGAKAFFRGQAASVGYTTIPVDVYVSLCRLEQEFELKLATILIEVFFVC